MSAQVLNGSLKPEEAAKKAEDGLASWYASAQEVDVSIRCGRPSRAARLPFREDA